MFGATIRYSLTVVFGHVWTMQCRQRTSFGERECFVKGTLGGRGHILVRVMLGNQPHGHEPVVLGRGFG